MIRERSCIVGEAGEARRVQHAEITPEFFQTLGIQLTQGRPFTDEEMNYGGRDQVAIITDQFWRDYFGADSECHRSRLQGERPAHPGHWRVAAGISIPCQPRLKPIIPSPIPGKRATSLGTPARAAARWADGGAAARGAVDG
jgi:hypothetical protein